MSPWTIPPTAVDAGFRAFVIGTLRRLLVDGNRFQQRLVQKAAASGEPGSAARLAALFWSGYR